MNRSQWGIVWVLLVVTLGVPVPRTWAGTYRLIAVVPVPGQRLSSFDISWVDPDARRYYLADRSNKAIDVINTQSNRFVEQIIPAPPNNFQGPLTGSKGGPNGVLAIHSLKELWVGDGDSTVKVVDLTTDTVVATIDTGGVKRADELAFDATDQLIIVANDADPSCPADGRIGPFFTFISTQTLTVKGYLCYPAATDGLEQTVWDPATNLFYAAIPATATNLGGEIAVIDPVTMTVKGTPFGVTRCNPHGLALGPGQQLLLGCSSAALDSTHPAQTLIIDKTTGVPLATITPLGGSDEVWFNPGDNHYYLAASSMTSNGLALGSGSPPATLTPVLGIIDAGDSTTPPSLIDKVPTAVGAHSVAADPHTNHIYVPFGAGAVAVYALD